MHMNPGESLPEGHLLDGRYRIRKVLGLGGMGRVYLSNDTRLANRPVAVKEMILGDGIAEKKAIEDFTREATVLARLTHPGIPTLIDHFAENSRHYLVMEFVAGGTLEDLLNKSGGKLSEDQTLSYARQMLEVLDFLHGQTPPIIYRDIKPGNIMIGKDGRAMLIDFGIARFLPKGGKATMIGSPGYAPPEQYAGKVEAPSDLYSLAATMHHLLSGRDPAVEPPFSFPPLKEAAPRVSAATAAAVDRALNHDMSKRFQSARAMLDALPSPSAAVSAPSGPIANGASGSLGAMPTVVLAEPVRSAPPSIHSSAPTPPRLVMPQGAPAPRPQTPSMKKAIDLGVRAKALIERGLKSKIVSSVITPGVPENPNQRAASGVSSTAKTRELVRQSAAPAASVPIRTPGRLRATPPASRPLFPELEKTIKAPTVGAPARLIARGESLEFPLKFAQTTIGRAMSNNGTGAPPDLDLGGLKRGVDRISRRHAEILQRDNDYFIRDLGSMNGTFIAGRGRLGRDQLYKLKDRDQIVLGGAILQFRRG